MSDLISADLPPDETLRRVLYHSGPAKAVLGRWRAAMRRRWLHGWSGVRTHAPSVMRMVADPRVLYVAGRLLQANGPKAPGPNVLRLENLSNNELWNMADTLGAALARNTYRPGKEQVKWVPKASKTGERPIVVMNGKDRAVQKAAAIVLRPMLDPLFDPLAFAFRPARKREHAVSVAVRLAEGGYPVWLTHDLRDAYGRVPLDRLLDVVCKLLPDPRLRDFLALVLPPQSRSVGGIKQGGPLSPTMMSVHLDHFFHRPVRRLGLDVRLLGWADDLLLAARTPADAAHADVALRDLLPAAGMELKDDLEAARTDLRQKPAEWLGFQFQVTEHGVQVRLGARAMDKLGERLLLAHSKCQPAQRAAQVLKGWVGQLGPCHDFEDRPAVCHRALALAKVYGFEEVPSEADLLRLLERAAGRAAEAGGQYEASGLTAGAGPVTPPCRPFVVW
jgi:hypothetical protein